MYQRDDYNYERFDKEKKYNDPYQIKPNFDDFNQNDEKHSVKKIFRITPQDLNLFFDKTNLCLPENKGESRISLNILKQCGYIQGLCNLLCTDQETGIVGNQIDIKRRQIFFGKNKIAIPTISSFIEILAIQFEEPNTMFLIVVATIHLLISLFLGDPNSFNYCLTIFSGVFFAAYLTASYEYLKQKQFLSLKDQINKEEVQVYRGHSGTARTIPVTNLVVGDVIQIYQGDRVPADCILIEEMNITANETLYDKSKGDVAKEISEGGDIKERKNRLIGSETDNHSQNPDPFLLSGSLVLTGQGKALVCSVGDNTLLARSRNQDDLRIKEQQTFLELKLEQASVQISKYAVISAILVVIFQTIFLVFKCLLYPDNLFHPLLSFDSIQDFSHIVITGICILIVSVPEGLPLAVSIAMSLSVDRLKKDQILIKNLEAVQTCSMLHDICIGKTGTITEGNLSVKKFHLFDSHKAESNIDDAFFKNKLYIQREMKDLIEESIISNCDVRYEIDDKTIQYVPKGQSLEVGMVKFLIQNQIDVGEKFVDRNRDQKQILCLPFCQYKKSMVVVRQNPNDETQVRVFLKGAPENVLATCNQTYNQMFQMQDFQEDDQLNALKIVSQQMAKLGLKTLSYGFKQIPKDELEQLQKDHDVESDSFRDALIENMIYIGTFGLEDPIRDHVQDSVRLIKYGTSQASNIDKNTKGIKNQVNIRMITGDHLETALKVAIDAEIITEEESRLEGIYLTGTKFRKEIGEYQKVWNKEKQIFEIKIADKKRFTNVLKRLRIIARANPDDKMILISGIRQEDGIVAMSGSNIADGEALKMANVGLCMNQGCQVSKDKSDLVILDNNFKSIHNAIMWGHTIYDNVKKFVQFQLTINITLVAVVILSALSLGQIPFNVVQLLWINQIMDTLGAIALCTEPYEKNRVRTQAELNFKRISRKNRIIEDHLWRNILGQFIYQFLVIVVLMYFGSLIFFDEPFHLIYTPIKDEQGNQTDRLVLNTIIFHTFVLMNLFNQINCRIIAQDDINIIKTLFNNKYFFFVIILEMLIQNYMVNTQEDEFFHNIFGVSSLTMIQQITCWVLGSLTLLVQIGVKQIPIDKLQFLSKINAEYDVDDNIILKFRQKFINFFDYQTQKLQEQNQKNQLELSQYNNEENI